MREREREREREKILPPISRLSNAMARSEQKKRLRLKKIRFSLKKKTVRATAKNLFLCKEFVAKTVYLGYS